MGAIASRYSSKSRTDAPTHGRTEKADIPNALAELLALGDLGWVVSCYQKLEPNDRAGDKFRIKLKNRLRKAEDRLNVLGFSHDDRESIIETLNAIEAHFRHAPNLAGARGIAVFAGQGWIRAVKMPSVLRSRVIVDRTPVVSELVALTESGSRILVAVADRTSARMFALSFEGIEELDGMVAPAAPRGTHYTEHGDRTTYGEYKFHNRIREEKQRHLARVADAVARAYRVRAFDGLVVGGIGVSADALLPHLPTNVRDHVLGVLSLAPKGTTAAVIREKAMELWLDAAGAVAADAVGELAGLLDTGWAVDGVDASLQALARGQVRTLVVNQDAELAGYRFATSGRLSRVASGSRGEGEAVPVADLLDDAIEDALRQRSRVAAVRGDLAKQFDQIAAILPVPDDQVKAVFFDAGGTLIHIDYPRIGAAIKQVLGRDVPPDDWIAADYAGRDAVEAAMASGEAQADTSRWRVHFSAMLASVGLSADDFTRVTPVVMEAHRQKHLWTSVQRGTADALAALNRAGFFVAVISNADGTVEKLLTGAGLTPHLRFVLDSGLVGVEKPDRRIFDLALERAGVSAAESYYVGDLFPVDVIGARNAGLTPVLLDPLGRYGHREVRTAPDVPSFARELVSAREAA